MSNGEEIRSSKVILTTGTFLRGQICIGNEVRPAGRMGDAPAVGLADTLDRLRFRLGRLKTGTPPRLRRSTIDFERTKVMPGDDAPTPFSFMNSEVWIRPEDQVPCHMTFTNEEVSFELRFSTSRLQ